MMKIIHRITFRTDGAAIKFFEAKGFKIKAGIINGFDISEDDPKWELIKDAMKRYGNNTIGDFQYKTEFTKKEVDSSQCLALISQWHFEYPQPSDAFEYEETIYKPGVGCRKCGMNLEQHNSFSIKTEPKWGKRNILQLNWIFGEYFISKEMKDKLEGRIPGVHFLEVLKYPKGTMLNNLFQLIIERYVSLAISKDAKFEICAICKGQKYLPHTRGFFPMPTEKNFAIAKSQEYFGSGGSAFRITIVGKATYQQLIDAGIKGVDFIPCG